MRYLVAEKSLNCMQYFSLIIFFIILSGCENRDNYQFALLLSNEIENILIKNQECESINDCRSRNIYKIGYEQYMWNRKPHLSFEVYKINNFPRVSTEITQTCKDIAQKNNIDIELIFYKNLLEDKNNLFGKSQIISKVHCHV
ncbi:hypothetical protein [Neisseria sp.]|uniref:hypothetical protein n=1 Tax=Neisseria sp. TaxID=192066 RepID=UPI002896FEC5|nr:hypothetical protein [Neisseria sp.]